MLSSVMRLAASGVRLLYVAATPGKRGYGWTSESQEITCEKCLKRLPVGFKEKDNA